MLVAHRPPQAQSVDQALAGMAANRLQPFLGELFIALFAADSY